MAVFIEAGAHGGGAAVLLVGLVVKNGILLIEVAEEQSHAGLPYIEALAHAGERRIRPIAMTTLATVFGLAPLALGIGSGAELQKPLALAVIGGLSVSAALSLIVLPSLAAWLHRLAGHHPAPPASSNLSKELLAFGNSVKVMHLHIAAQEVICILARQHCHLPISVWIERSKVDCIKQGLGHNRILGKQLQAQGVLRGLCDISCERHAGELRPLIDIYLGGEADDLRPSGSLPLDIRGVSEERISARESVCGPGLSERKVAFLVRTGAQTRLPDRLSIFLAEIEHIRAGQLSGDFATFIVTGVRVGSGDKQVGGALKEARVHLGAGNKLQIFYGKPKHRDLDLVAKVSLYLCQPRSIGDNWQ